MNNFYPEIIIDGEIAYDVLMYDSFIFYGTIIFLITFLCIYKFIKTSPEVAVEIGYSDATPVRALHTTISVN